MLNMSHLVLQEFCWFLKRRCIRNWCLSFNSHHCSSSASVKASHIPCRENLLMDHIGYNYHLSSRLIITVSIGSERLRFAVTRQSLKYSVSHLLLCDLITKAFIYLIQWGRKQEFNGPPIHCHSDTFVLWRTRCLQDSLRPSSAPKIREKDCCWLGKPSDKQAQPSREFKHVQNFKFITSSFDFIWSAHTLKMLVHFTDTVQVSNIFLSQILELYFK